MSDLRGTLQRACGDKVSLSLVYHGVNDLTCLSLLNFLGCSVSFIISGVDITFVNHVPLRLFENPNDVEFVTRILVVFSIEPKVRVVIYSVRQRFRRTLIFSIKTTN